MKKKQTSSGEISSVGSLLKQSLVLFKARFNKFAILYLFLLLVSLPMFIASSILYFMPGLLNGVSMILMILAIIFGVFVLYYAVLVYIGSVLLIAKPNDEDTRGILTKAKSYFWAYILIGIITQVLVMLWSMLFIIPGIIFGLYYSLAIYSLLVEGFQGKTALNRSKELIKGHWWSVFGKYAVLMLIFFVIIFVINIPSYFLEGDSLQVWGHIVTVISYIINWLFTFFFLIYGYLIYSDLVKIKGKSKLTDKGSSKHVGWWIAAVVLLVVPFMATIMVVAIGNARVIARDAHRVSDVKMIQVGLELYYNDQDMYPAELNDLIEVGVFADGVPTNPLPSDGDCPKDFEYQYEQIEDGANYELIYCLGDKSRDGAGLNLVYNNGLSVETNNSNQYEEVSKKVLYDTGDKVITVETTRSLVSMDIKILVNDIVVKSSYGYDNSEGGLYGKFYSISKKDIVVFQYPVAGRGAISYSYFFLNIETEEVLLSYANIGKSVNSNNFYALRINDIRFSDLIEENGCDGNSSTNEVEAQKLKPSFLGFEFGEGVSYDKDILFKTYNATTKGDLYCDFYEVSYDDENIVLPRNTNKQIIGVNSDLTKVYFSVEGNGWKSNYSYDIEAEKIIKEGPSDLLELVLVEEF